jgi:flagellar hook assembly protein FlgD
MKTVRPGKRSKTVILALLLAGLSTPGWIISGCASAGEIRIDTEVPEVSYISPKNSDGVQDELVVPATIIKAAKQKIRGYRLTVLDPEGNSVRTSEQILPAGISSPFGKNKQAVSDEQVVIWDGRSDSGQLVADGEYRYRLEAWDRKGTQGASPLLAVVVDDTPPVVELFCAYAVFSPNRDGRLDAISISQRRSSEEKRWDARFLSSSGAAVRRMSWEGRLGDFDWDGLDDSGAVSRDGIYTYVVSSTDLAGNSASFSLTGLTIDTRPSPVSLDLDTRSFSPNADGRKDLLRLYPRLERTEDVNSWEIKILDEEGTLARAYSGQRVPPGMIVFDGKDGKGQRLPDGTYLGVLSVLYGNGDNPAVASPEFHIDTAMPRAALSAPYLIFSPDGDGRRDTLLIHQHTSIERQWTAEIVNAAGHQVRKASWEDTRAEFAWDGTDDGGALVSDGSYVYRLSSTDDAENTNTVELKGIRIDTRPTPASLSAGTAGFSPNGDGIMDNMIVSITVGQLEEIESWKLDFVHRDGDVRKVFSGGQYYPLPARLSWNGRDDEGRITEGTYQAVLLIEYAKGNIAEARSKIFTLDISPPQVTVNISPTPFSPDGDGVDDLLSIGIEARDSSPIEDWVVKILDPMEHDFTSFSGSGLPAAIRWNGYSEEGELVQSAEDYPILVTVRDNLWNAATVQAAIPVDILVMRDGDKLKIIISSIYFKPYTADYTDMHSIDPQRVDRNLKTLDRLAEILKKYQGYKIRIEGHAVMIYWDQPSRARLEQEQVLLPLSLSRAEVIKDALVQRGVRAERMSTTGFGGLLPVVPHGDLDNRWKNRRVEFILVKQ